jgi:hypothetical protein
MKEDGREVAERTDFLWDEIVGAYATWGGSSGWDRLATDPENRSKLAYQALAALSPADRHRQIHEVLGQVGVRWPNKKTDYLNECFQQIESLGGPEEATELLLAQKGTQAKIRFLMTLRGIGPKYARDIMMAPYHEDFRNTIAVDTRIKRISQCLGLNFSDYDEEERFYQSVAEKAGINGWELDRLMYNYRDEFLESLADRGYQTGFGGRSSGCPGH